MRFINTTYQEIKMAKKVTAVVKLQLPAGKATPAPPVGSALGPHGINIPGIYQRVQRKDRGQGGIDYSRYCHYLRRSFSFVLKTPPAPVLIKKACGIETASAVPNKTKVANITKAQIEEIAKTKMVDLNAASLESACSMIAGTARSMGIVVVD